ncbi:adhesion G-protein coupled receptor G6 isoform X7 [Hemibagrus wyckioides]|uniref:adhesion G-protein coupled receptor G6 isoform X7 n=1 Tax=Hemibagrus wyckioides TaxID=337641 RepID=UPI00266C8B2E|nr:adhesion G-protein coupled receptor G6 isoform X7 [Hemibagrus wyckioides]
MVSFISGRWWRWKFWNVLQVSLILLCAVRTVLSCQGPCDETLTSSSGIFTSPCYPSDYPSSLTCTWTLQAPAGFVLQLTFMDFELEEAQGCIYDSVVVSTGVKFCGLTANGLTLNSSTNVMVVTFNSDFSVQKKGFSISYSQVAVALRNQKVTVPQNSKDVVRVSSTVSIPALSQFTACFEIAGQTQTGSGIIFSYTDKEPHLTFGNSGNTMDLIIGNATCPVNDLVTLADFTASMQPFCLTWSSTNGAVGVYFRGSYQVKFCSSSVGLRTVIGGSFELGRGKKQGQNFEGLIYNFRLWNSAMTYPELSALTCDTVGNVVDWDNSFWEIPASYAQTDSSLSCNCFPQCVHLTTTLSSSGTAVPVTTSQTNSCVSSGVSCPDLSITISYTSAPSISLTADTVQTTSPATSSSTSSSTSTAAATNPLSILSSKEFNFYRISLILSDDLQITDEAVEQWLNQTFQDWNHTIYATNISILLGTESSGTTVKRYSCKALLVYKNTTGKLLTDADIMNRLKGASAASFTLENITANTVENCPAEEMPLHYKWPESRPLATYFIPCFPYKEQNASRRCMISPHNYSSFWEQPDRTNCKDIEEIEVSQENAADVAVQLADITNNELSNAELSKVVTVVTKLVNVARINFTLASTVVNIISNVMVSSEAVQLANSEMALRTMDKLVQKIEFDGPSLTITSKNLAVGISAINTSSFPGANFSAFMALNSSDPQIDFESEVQNPLASVSLPATLLHNLSEADVEIISRIHFMFFSKTGLFQHFGSLMDQQNNNLSLNSYVVASSVGNFSISNLKDPVQIEIAHLQNQNQNRLCVFWDFSIKNGTGGWNSEGCRVSPESNSNKTVCLCDHLTHFGVLMDLSGASVNTDEKNTKILTFITYIGCGVSAIFSAVTILTYVAFEKLRRDYPSKILMNLSTSLLFLNMTFLLDGWLASYEMQGLCMAVAAFLHFFLLTSFTWMGLESVHMYIALVKVFNTYIRRYILKFCIVGWGLPAVIVALVLASDKNSYGKEFYGKGASGQGLSEFCWIRSKVVFYVTCVSYFCVIFLLNVAMFIVVMMQICGRNGKRNNRTLQEEVLRNLRSVISLTFLLGMTWGFAFFAWGPVNLAFMYLFSIFNSLQGLFIFIFHCALKENVQKQWRRYLCCGKLRLADNSDWSKTATNNTKKVSSDNIGKSLSSSSYGSTTVNWTSRARVTLNPFAKRHSSSGKPYSNQTIQKCSTSDSDASTSSILPVHQVLDKVKGYCSVRSDNFYKNIILSDSFSHSTKF